MSVLDEFNTLETNDGVKVNVGGTVADNQIFDSTETTSFVWDYDPRLADLRKLYEKGKSSQWNGSTDLDWTTDVDLEKPLFEEDPAMVEEDWYKKFTPKEKITLNIESNNQTLHQFLHGEQGALIATSQLVGAVPFIDSKYYASTQVMDEARHVEVFARYVDEKMDGHYDITENLFGLLKAITSESRWDFKFIGMQLLVEGLALAAFVNMLNRCKEPLLKRLLRMVMQDEARHVAYGVLSLKNYYADMPLEQKRERQEFIYEAMVMMRDRLFNTEAAQRMGVPKATMDDYLTRSPIIKQFRNLLFVNVVPNIKRIGLLDGWLKEKFDEMGVLALQDFDSDALLESYIYGDNSLDADRSKEAS